MRPSFISTGISGTLAFIGTVFILIEIYKNYNNMNLLTIGMLLLLMAIAFGVHAIGHYVEEIYFNFNPLIGKWAINDYPVNR